MTKQRRAQYNPLAEYQGNDGFRHRKHALPDGTHEFCSNDANEMHCRFCGGYPFDLQHWTI